MKRTVRRITTIGVLAALGLAGCATPRHDAETIEAYSTFRSLGGCDPTVGRMDRLVKRDARRRWPCDERKLSR